MPDGWAVALLGEVATVNPSEQPLAADAPFVRMDAVEPGARWPRYYEERRDRSGARARGGDTIFARITPCLENGKVAQIPADVDRCGGSTEFIVVRAAARLDPDYLYLWATSSKTREVATGLMTGTTGRQRLAASDLAALPIPIPPLAEQRRIADLIGAIDDAIQPAQAALHWANEAGRSLRDTRVEQLWSGPLRPLGDLVERIRRPLPVTPNTPYSEIGIRSHGKGIFHKPDVLGEQLGNKAIFSIEPGDLVFNIVFAWEGAVAVAGALEAGRCGSHRFPTYRALPNVDVLFLLHVLLSSRGLPLLGLASPGSAGRNRTLNQSSLLRFLVPAPDILAQERLVGDLAGVAAVVAAQERNLKALQRLRDAVLADIMLGHHEIPDSYDRFLDGAA